MHSQYSNPLCPKCDTLAISHLGSTLCPQCGHLINDLDLRNEDFTLVHNPHPSENTKGKLSMLTLYNPQLARDYKIKATIESLSKKIDIPDIARSQAHNLTQKVLSADSSLSKRLKLIINSIIYMLLKPQTPTLSLREFSQKCDQKPTQILKMCKLLEKHVPLEQSNLKQTSSSNSNEYFNQLQLILARFLNYSYIEDGKIKFTKNSEENRKTLKELKLIFTPSIELPLLKSSKAADSPKFLLPVLNNHANKESQASQLKKRVFEREIETHLISGSLKTGEVLQKIAQKLEKYSKALINYDKLYVIKHGKRVRNFVLACLLLVCRAFEIPVSVASLVQLADCKYITISRIVKIIEVDLLGGHLPLSESHRRTERAEDGESIDNTVVLEDKISEVTAKKKKKREDQEKSKNWDGTNLEQSTNRSNDDDTQSREDGFKRNRNKVLRKMIQRLSGRKE